METQRSDEDLRLVQEDADRDADLFIKYIPMLAETYGKDIESQIQRYCVLSRVTPYQWQRREHGNPDVRDLFFARSVRYWSAYLGGRHWLRSLPQGITEKVQDQIYLEFIDPDISLFLAFRQFAIFAVIVGIGFLYAAYLLHAHSRTAPILLAEGLSFLAIVVVSLVFTNVVRWIQQNIRPRRANTDAFSTVCNLLIIMPSLTDPDIRRLFLRMLEALADRIESQLPRQLGLGSSAGDLAVSRQFSYVARKVRKLRIWVATPQRETTQHLEAEIAIIGGAIASGFYHYLIDSAEAGAPVVEVRKPLKVILSVFARVLVGLLPGMGYLLVMSEWASKVSSIAQSAWLTLSIASAITAVTSLVPDYRGLVSTMKDVKTIIPSDKNASSEKK